MAGIVEGLLLEDALVQQRGDQRRRSPVEGADGGVVLAAVVTVHPQQAGARAGAGVADLDIQRADDGEGLQEALDVDGGNPELAEAAGARAVGAPGVLVVLAAGALAAGAPVAQAVQPPGDEVGQGGDVGRARVYLDDGIPLPAASRQPPPLLYSTGQGAAGDGCREHLGRRCQL